MDGSSPKESLSPAETVALTRAMVSGKEEAYRHFHELYAWRLFRLAATILRGDLETAQDLVQETMVRLVRNIRKFDQESAFWNWLAAIVRNVAIDHQRKQFRQKKLWENRVTLPLETEWTPAPGIDLLENALSQLDLGTADLLRRKYFDCLSMKDIAQMDGIGVEAVESRLARARNKLREIMVSHQESSHE